MKTISNNNLTISLIRNVEIPKWATSGSAGLDFFVPVDEGECFVSDDVSLVYLDENGKAAAYLEPGQDLLIASGVKVKLSPGTALIAFNKSGVAMNKNLIVGACVIDNDYQGEIHLHVINVGKRKEVVRGGDKLVQFVLFSIPSIEEIIVVPESSLYEVESERSIGGFGSTDKHDFQGNESLTCAWCGKGAKHPIHCGG
jgi:deoxyuridine 5'-triphosphate nucleotidohydrolase